MAAFENEASGDRPSFRRAASIAHQGPRSSFGVALLVAVAFVAGACQQQTAEISSEPPVIGERTARDADPVAPTAPLADGPATSVPGTTLTPTAAPPTVGAQAPAESVTGGGTEQLDDAPESEWDTALPARWAAMGCGDATDIQVWLFDSVEAVAAAAKKMPVRLWLCPDNTEVNCALECYREETANLLRVIGEELGASVAEALSDISTSTTVFCASGTAIRLQAPTVTPSP